MFMRQFPATECRKSVPLILERVGVHPEVAERVEHCVGEVSNNCRLHGGEDVVNLGIQADEHGVFVVVDSPSHIDYRDSIMVAICNATEKNLRCEIDKPNRHISRGLFMVCYYADRVELTPDGKLIMAFGPV
jgi:anti-sigma regulatory factor (Ser/Thr protein kinase)